MAAGLVVTPGVKITRALGRKHEGSDLQQVYISWILVPTKTPVPPRCPLLINIHESVCVCVHECVYYEADLGQLERMTVSS